MTAASTTAASSVPSCDDIRARFERDGYACPIRVLSDDEVRRYANHYHAYVDRNRARLDALPANQK